MDVADGVQYQKDHPTQRSIIELIAGKFGFTAQTLCNWVHQVEHHRVLREGLTISVLNNRELRQAIEILRQSSAYFAAADTSTGPVHTLHRAETRFDERFYSLTFDAIQDHRKKARQIEKSSPTAHIKTERGRHGPIEIDIAMTTQGR